jgi:hypothetical protein
MLKINLSNFLKKCKLVSIYFVSLKKKNKFQVDEMLDFLTFLLNAHLKFIYALSTSTVKIIICQNFNVKKLKNTILLVNFKNTFDLILVLKFLKLYIQHIIK